MDNFYFILACFKNKDTEDIAFTVTQKILCDAFSEQPMTQSMLRILIRRNVTNSSHEDKKGIA